MGVVVTDPRSGLSMDMVGPPPNMGARLHFQVSTQLDERTRRMVRSISSCMNLTDAEFLRRAIVAYMGALAEGFHLVWNGEEWVEAPDYDAHPDRVRPVGMVVEDIRGSDLVPVVIYDKKMKAENGKWMYLPKEEAEKLREKRDKNKERQRRFRERHKKESGS